MKRTRSPECYYSPLKITQTYKLHCNYDKRNWSESVFWFFNLAEKRLDQIQELLQREQTTGRFTAQYQRDSKGLDWAQRDLKGLEGSRRARRDSKGLDGSRRGSAGLDGARRDSTGLGGTRRG